MKSFAFAIVLLIPFALSAAVVDLQTTPVQEVLEVYEDEQPTSNSDQGWIYNFEKVSLGHEMDHLAKLKQSDDQLME